MDIIRRGRTLVLTGDFDVRSTTRVRDAINEQLAEATDDLHAGPADPSESEPEVDLVVDLSRVDSVDPTALKVLAMATRRASRAGQHLVLRGCGPAVRRMLHLTRLIRVVELERLPSRR